MSATARTGTSASRRSEPSGWAVVVVVGMTAWVWSFFCLLGVAQGYSAWFDLTPLVVAVAFVAVALVLRHAEQLDGDERPSIAESETS